MSLRMAFARETADRTQVCSLEAILVDDALEEGTLECLKSQLLHICGLLAVSSCKSDVHILCCMLVGDNTPSGTKLQVRICISLQFPACCSLFASTR